MVRDFVIGRRACEKAREVSSALIDHFARYEPNMALAR